MYKIVNITKNYLEFFSKKNIKKYTDNKEIIKIIYVKNKLVNIVVKN